MAVPLILKRTSVPGRVPTTDNIGLGDIAFNTYDGKIYIKKSQSGTDSVVEVTGGVRSVNGTSGETINLNTDDVDEGSVNFYYQDTRARAAISAGSNLAYDSSTGVITCTIDTSAFVSLTGSETVSNKILTSTTLRSVKEAVVAIGNTGTSNIIDLTNGNFQTATLTDNCTFTMPALEAGKYFSLLLKTGGGGYTASFTGVKFADGVSPTITATASRADLIAFVCDGTYWYGNFVQNYSV